MEPLIGRSAELERIDAVLSSRDMLPVGLLFHGREGSGKTTLWQEAIRRAHGRGFRVLDCALSRNESRLTFAGLADLVRPVLDEVLPELAPPQALALETALALTSGGASPPDERAVAFGLHGAVSALARRTPLALAIDDIQWLDPSSALMLAYALRRLRHEPVMLVLAHRDGEDLDRLISLTDGTGVAFERIPVGGLPLGAVHRLIRTRLGFSLTRPQLLRIHAASDGNPLHALELARAIYPGATAAPDSLLTLLANRVAALPEGSRLALALAGIATDSDLDVLTRAYGPHLRDELHPAVVADLVTLASGHVRFTHPLIATAAETSVSDARRRELHDMLARVAATLEGRIAHMAMATLSPDRDVADSVEQAALTTRRRGARATSAQLFASAARLTPAMAHQDSTRRRLRAAEAWYEAGDARHAEEILAALLDELEDGDQRCEAGWRLGILRDEVGRWQEAVVLWRQALAAVDNPGLRSRILCSLAITTIYTGSVREARSQAAAAVAAAEQSQDRACLARALAARALTLAMSGAPGHAAVLERALALEAIVDEPLGDWSPSAVAAECARHAGDIEGSRRHYRAVLDRAVNAGDANVEQWAAYGLATAELLAGAYPRASDLADVVLDLADQTGQMRIPARTLRASVDAHLGQIEEARRLIAEAIASASAADEATHLLTAYIALGGIEETAGDATAAARAYAEARRLAAEIGLAHATVLRAFLNEAEAAATTGMLDQAAGALAAFDVAVHGRPPAWSDSIVHRARGAVLAARGEFGSAEGELEAALDDATALPADRGRALLALGSVRRRLRAHARARAALEAAVEIFTQLGALPWIERTRRELARIPGRRTGEQDRLTEAEARIAELVSAGQSNREVAAALFVSVKTVEVTLTRVYQKVGIRSRTELAHRLGTSAKQ